MKLSMFTLITNAIDRKDAFVEAIQSYCEMADEVIVVDGARNWRDYAWAKHVLKVEHWHKANWIKSYWPYNYTWEEFPRHYQLALDNCDGDWVFAMCIDHFIHERYYNEIHTLLENVEAPLISFRKLSLLFGGKYYQKFKYPLAMNVKQYRSLTGLGLGFGRCATWDNDWVYPLMVQGRTPDGIDFGDMIPEDKVYRSNIPYFNYDSYFRTQKIQTDHFWRLSKARNIRWGDWLWGDTPEHALEAFLKEMKDRMTRVAGEFKLEEHPKVMQPVIQNLSTEQFGYNGWGLV